MSNASCCDSFSCSLLSYVVPASIFLPQSLCSLDLNQASLVLSWQSAVSSWIQNSHGATGTAPVLSLPFPLSSCLASSCSACRPLPSAQKPSPPYGRSPPMSPKPCADDVCGPSVSPQNTKVSSDYYYQRYGCNRSVLHMCPFDDPGPLLYQDNTAIIATLLRACKQLCSQSRISPTSINYKARVAMIASRACKVPVVGC